MSDIVDNTQFQDILRGSRSGFFRYGIAFDKDFEIKEELKPKKDANS